MARAPKPWYRKDRKCWFVTIAGERHNLGPVKAKALKLFHELMSAEPQQPVPRTAAGGQSVAEILDAFLEWCQQHRSNGTYDWYLERCQYFADSEAASLSIDQFKPFHLQQWADGHSTWSDGHKRGCMIAIQRPFRWAEKMGIIDRNPIAFVEKPPQGKREQVIAADEYKAILANVRGEPFRDLLTVAWETGARPQELLGVEARHVDEKHSRWIFPKEEAKGKKRIRIVYLSETALAICQRLMQRRPQGKLFRNADGQPWTPYAVNCRFNRLKAKPETKYCLYLFRHSFATRKLEQGLDAMTVSILMNCSTDWFSRNVFAWLSGKTS